MGTGRQPHILNAASNLTGICFVLITALRITGQSDHTYADEICILSSIFFLIACVLSYLSVRVRSRPERCERVADYTFFAGLSFLFIGVLVYARDFF